MPSEINIILFDLGNTLIYSKNPWNGILFKGIMEFLRSIILIDPSIKEKISASDIQDCMNQYYDLRVENLVETTSFNILRSCLQSKNISSITDGQLRTALQAMYSVTQSNWGIGFDTIPTLNHIKEKDYHLGLLSNAADDLDVQQLIDRWKLRHFFEFILTSAVCGFRKPHPRLFHEALSFFNASPANVMMVGDTLNADILGANKLGMFSVLLDPNDVYSQENSDVKPSMIINNLREIIPLLDSLKH